MPAVIGDPDVVIRSLLAQHAAAHGATPIRVVYEHGAPTNVKVNPDGTAFTLPDRRTFTTPLLGAHQAANTAVALAMADLLPLELRPTEAELHRGLPNVLLPGRFQRVGKYLFDVAHNPDGAAVLVNTLAAIGPAKPIVAVLSVLSDKDWRGIMDVLGPVVDQLILTNAPTSPPNRAWHLPEPLAYARAKGFSAELVRDFDRALELGAERGATVLITGSFHTVGDAMSRLEVSPTGG